MLIKNNFLPKENLETLHDLVFGVNFPWFFQSNVTCNDDKQEENYYFVHTIYNDNQVNSAFFNTFNENLLNKLKINSLIRVKINFYHKTKTLIKHDFHTDFDFPHKTALFYFNNNDGFTEFKNGTKIDSYENRLLTFDGLQQHRSTTCTNAKGRFNININYI